MFFLLNEKNNKSKALNDNKPNETINLNAPRMFIKYKRRLILFFLNNRVIC
jgi:hypothetical protein